MIIDDKTTIAMFTKLMEIRSVASNRFGRSSNPYTNLCLDFWDSFNSNNCTGVIAKKAVSAPEINPDTKRSPNRTMISIKNGIENVKAGFRIDKSSCDCINKG